MTALKAEVEKLVPAESTADGARLPGRDTSHAHLRQGRDEDRLRVLVALKQHSRERVSAITRLAEPKLPGTGHKSVLAVYR